jgi:tetratricopeptide (TPR) repeat protein
VQAYLKLATTLRARKEYKTAEEAYIKVLNLRPSHPQGQLGLAQVQAASNRELNAIARYQDYLRNPQVQRDTDALFNANLELGQVFRRARMFGQAIASLQAAQRLNPESSAVFLELARAYTDTAEYDRARTAAITAVQKAARDPEPYNMLATIQLRTNELESAAATARRSIELARAALQNQSDNLAMLRSLREYYTLYSQILQNRLAREPQNTAVRVDLVRAVQEQATVGHILALHTALDVLRGAPAEVRNDPQFLEVSIETLQALQRHDEAVRLARQLQQLQPGNAIAARVLERAAARGAASAPAPAATP